MCTAISFKTKNHYFGRNLDLEYSYIETITVTPRNYLFHFRQTGTLSTHYAMIGTAYIQDSYPLYYDATNEKGLSMAGLNFPDNAYYFPPKENKDNITPFEFIPWILGQCASIDEARILLEHINLLDQPFSDKLPLSPLHWMIADKNESIVVESLKSGLHIHENPVGVLTNNPPFHKQLLNLKNYTHLPGEWSSESRFVRASFVKQNSKCGISETESVNQFFHILDSIAIPRGCKKTESNEYPITIYSSCCNTDKGIYYYKTYENFCITAVDMHRENLDSSTLICYTMKK